MLVFKQLFTFLKPAVPLPAKLSNHGGWGKYYPLLTKLFLLDINACAAKGACTVSVFWSKTIWPTDTQSTQGLLELKPSFILSKSLYLSNVDQMSFSQIVFE
jgi:hypothetical protein